MSDKFFPAISTFDVAAAERTAVGCDCVGAEPKTDHVQLQFSPSGLSVKGRYWREGPYLKAVVHIVAAAGEPRTISAQVDLRPIARALRKWQRRRGVDISGWPGSWVKKVKRIAKSKLLKSVANAVKSVAKSKLTGAALGAAAIVFPPVGVPAAAAYATANAALAALERANEARKAAKTLLTRGGPALLKQHAPELAKALRNGRQVQNTLRDIARRAKAGDIGAQKTARILSIVNKHRGRVQHYDRKLRGNAGAPTLPVTPQGQAIPPQALRLAAQRVATQTRLLPPARRVY